jgi:hypothetical protein
MIETLLASTVSAGPLFALRVHCDYCGAAIVHSIACGLCRECAKLEADRATVKLVAIEPERRVA